MADEITTKVIKIHKADCDCDSWQDNMYFSGSESDWGQQNVGVAFKRADEEEDEEEGDHCARAEFPSASLTSSSHPVVGIQDVNDVGN